MPDEHRATGGAEDGSEFIQDTMVIMETWFFGAWRDLGFGGLKAGQPKGHPKSSPWGSVASPTMDSLISQRAVLAPLGTHPERSQQSAAGNAQDQQGDTDPGEVSHQLGVGGVFRQEKLIWGGSLCRCRGTWLWPLSNPEAAPTGLAQGAA